MCLSGHMKSRANNCLLELAERRHVAIAQQHVPTKRAPGIGGASTPVLKHAHFLTKPGRVSPTFRAKRQTKIEQRQLASISLPTKHRAQRTNTSSSHDLGEHRPSSCELKDNCKGTNHTIIEFELTRIGASYELSQ